MLRIQLLGGIRLSRGGQSLPSFPTQKATSLFLFLVLNRNRLHPREVLVGRFWGDRPEAVARRCLRTTIWRVRSVLEPRGTEAGTYLTIQGNVIGFNQQTDYWLDVEEFERRVQGTEVGSSPALDGREAQSLQQAIELYRGDLLEGIYDEWCLLERERLKATFLCALERLMHYHAGRGEWNSAVSHARRLLGYDPLREHIHRDLMELYYRMGDRPAALSQYSTCAGLLREELGIEPMRETTELYETIRAESHLARESGEVREATQSGSRATDAADPGSVLARFHSAAGDLDRVSAELWKSIRELERQEVRKRVG